MAAFFCAPFLLTIGRSRHGCPMDQAKLKALMDEVAGGSISPEEASNRLEKLKGSRRGQYSIRVNKQWRICFRWRDANAHNVEIVDYH